MKTILMMLLIALLGATAWALIAGGQTAAAAQTTTATVPHIPLIGETAPAFTAQTTQGMINFPADYKGKWVILFSHPSDFTPVCTTEFIVFQQMTPEFKALNCELIGLSEGSLADHTAWLAAIEKLQYRDTKNVKITFPVIADQNKDVATKYGMIHPTANDTKTVRAVFLIDPNSTVRALIYYPFSSGRNFQEIKRLLISLQTTDTYKVSTPANWQPGEDVIVPAASVQKTTNAQNPGGQQATKDGAYCLNDFLCLKRMPKEMINTGTPVRTSQK